MQAQRESTLSSRAVGALGPAGWLVIGAALATHLAFANRSSDAEQLILVASLGVFFAILLLRLALAAAITPKRRGALLVLMAAITLWAVGASAVNADKLSDVAQFPAPGEWLFLASYVGMAAYLILEERHRMSRGLATWLDVTVICGGTACVAATLLLLPVATASDKTGVSLLLALLYPLIDLALALLVVAQVVLRVRPDLKHAIMTCAGFVLLAYADGLFVTSVASNTYTFSAVSDVIWGAAFALIVGSACRQSTTALSAVPRRRGSSVLVFAATAAIAALTFRPSGGLAAYVAVPAVITLLAAGGRLVLALREAKGAADALALSQTDDLTMLPNRRAVRVRLDEALAAGQPVALMVLDMDSFKEINDTLGHAAGDTVLQLAAHRMRDVLTPDIMFARLGGDEFAVVTRNTDEIELLECAQVILDALSEPLMVDGIEIAPSASVGIALRTESDVGSSELLRRADVAMYQAKVTEMGAVLYDPHRDDFSRVRLQQAEELRKGIADGQLVLWYQPQIDTLTGQVCGLEALIRWRHPTQGLLSPAAFLPAARRGGIMLMLSDEVARQAVVDVKWLRERGLTPRVAINCAPPELLSGVFLPRLYKLLAESGVPADTVVVEVTEDSFLADPARAREVLYEMREHNLQIAIDDYGTGFSSLSYLRELPVQELKIDRSFVATIGADPRGRMIVVSTVQMAHALGLRTVAEGVEDAATAIDLIKIGVDVLQGYHMARPMPLAEVEPWVREWSNFIATVGAWPLSNPAETIFRARAANAADTASVARPASLALPVPGSAREAGQLSAASPAGTMPAPALPRRPDQLLDLSGDAPRD
jgi:diguanylate cyclase (GGDEF)-like protein